ncbi:hypothetical protein BC831DRAFT_441209 [Entophlyctis helioformis]|nr:hypothetical protein BC831DRAFT_441209 [Entophlyctis helioformis]
MSSPESSALIWILFGLFCSFVLLLIAACVAPSFNKSWLVCNADSEAASRLRESQRLFETHLLSRSLSLTSDPDPLLLQYPPPAYTSTQPEGMDIRASGQVSAGSVGSVDEGGGDIPLSTLRRSLSVVSLASEASSVADSSTTAAGWSPLPLPYPPHAVSPHGAGWSARTHHRWSASLQQQHSPPASISGSSSIRRLSSSSSPPPLPPITPPASSSASASGRASPRSPLRSPRAPTIIFMGGPPPYPAGADSDSDHYIDMAFADGDDGPSSHPSIPYK